MLSLDSIIMGNFNVLFAYIFHIAYSERDPEKVT